MNIEEAYKVMQAEWVRLYNVEVGDTVKVLRAAKTRELGWGNSWEMVMNAGSEREVRSVSDGNIDLDDGYGYPFFVLELVKKAEPTIEINIKINGETRKLSDISQETLLNIRSKT